MSNNHSLEVLARRYGGENAIPMAALNGCLLALEAPHVSTRGHS